ncbi:hypothetical protein [Austwickia sp. TVS 96-490-7B]|uniref:hypothetical protein n=1 Tax=Austwickia sp. TVS 96-490-7B TaxID=2830843 RepID=UPI001C573A02|nr:hypothetical protein [Austwickia sp. TVS 96-490-7B]
MEELRFVSKIIESLSGEPSSLKGSVLLLVITVTIPVPFAFLMGAFRVLIQGSFTEFTPEFLSWYAIGLGLFLVPLIWLKISEWKKGRAGH